MRFFSMFITTVSRSGATLLIQAVESTTFARSFPLGGPRSDGGAGTNYPVVSMTWRTWEASPVSA